MIAYTAGHASDAAVGGALFLGWLFVRHHIGRHAGSSTRKVKR